MDKTDEGLLGNEKIEDAIAALQQQPTQELLAHALTVVRRRMRENGQVIIAVEPNGAAGQMKLQAEKPPTVRTGGRFLPASTKN